MLFYWLEFLPQLSMCCSIIHKHQLEVDPNFLTSYKLEGWLQIEMYLVIIPPCDLTL